MTIGNTCEFRRGQGKGTKVLQGTRHGHLFLLDIKVIPPYMTKDSSLIHTPVSTVLNVSSTTELKNSFIWHKQMAHVNL